MKNNKNLKLIASKLNKEIFKKNLSILNFGNASIIDKKRKKLFIKASGLGEENITPSNIVELEISKFNINKKYPIKPSVDTIIHIELYKYLKNINCIIHTHSEYSTIMSQANIEPECLGTTHADYFKDKIPLSDKIYKVEKGNYERQLSQSIISKLKKRNLNYPGILLRDHGVFAWGKNDKDAINNLIAIEYICKLYFKTKMLINKPKISKYLAEFHYNRKNGKNKYYGQNN